ncbi:MAG TPA: DNA repair protein RecO [Candidatus Omnitrophica bacterium]|nr:DNA repair protein RecO [Candidatus Omnitrophota bacterium]HBQ38365.1 DNA repair protein RecO [Candidatus Omnitrophota bacterium]
MTTGRPCSSAGCAPWKIRSCPVFAMGIHTADAIVLRRYPYRETSVLVTCLTDRFGKIKGLVKGLRVPVSRHRSAMEPLTLNRLVFYDTRSSSLHLISQCDLLEAFPSIQRELEVARVAASCIEVVDAVLEPEEPQADIFRLTRDTLNRLAGSVPSLPSVWIHFVVRLLRLVGFHPQLDECTGCSRQPTRRGFWSVGQGGVVCEACLHHDPSAEPIEGDWVDELVGCGESDGPVWTLQHGPMLVRRLNEFLSWRVERPLKTIRSAR